MEPKGGVKYCVVFTVVLFACNMRAYLLMVAGMFHCMDTYSILVTLLLKDTRLDFLFSTWAYILFAIS